MLPGVSHMSITVFRQLDVSTTRIIILYSESHTSTNSFFFPSTVTVVPHIFIVVSSKYLSLSTSTHTQYKGYYIKFAQIVPLFSHCLYYNVNITTVEVEGQSIGGCIAAYILRVPSKLSVPSHIYVQLPQDQCCEQKHANNFLLHCTYIYKQEKDNKLLSHKPSTPLSYKPIPRTLCSTLRVVPTYSVGPFIIQTMEAFVTSPRPTVHA